MAQHRPKMAQHRPKMAQHSPMMAQHSPRMAQHRPKMAEHSTKKAQRSFKVLQQSLNIIQHSIKTGQHSTKIDYHSYTEMVIVKVFARWFVNHWREPERALASGGPLRMFLNMFGRMARMLQPNSLGVPRDLHESPESSRRVQRAQGGPTES